MRFTSIGTMDQIHRQQEEAAKGTTISALAYLHTYEFNNQTVVSESRTTYTSTYTSLRRVMRKIVPVVFDFVSVYS